MSETLLKKALTYHRKEPRGKIELSLSKPLSTQRELSLAYTPGVGEVSAYIAKHPKEVWNSTNRANTIAIVSDGSAVLGLGNIGPEAALPVMEGKAALFKSFANINAYPLCLKIPETDVKKRVKKMLEIIGALEPTLAGINLEDIKAPECFLLEAELKKRLNIPVFHDDQHGTAIIVLAGLINALKITGKQMKEIKVVMSGAGAAGIATAKLLVSAGLKRDQLLLCDSKGLITTTRKDLTSHKLDFARNQSECSLSKAMKGADVFIGVSKANMLSERDVKHMNKNAIVFALANPTPEILPKIARKAGAAIAASGRSDFANQLNNSLGFPGIFRGTLDAGAKEINDAMKLATAYALAKLAEEPFPEKLREKLQKAYPNESETFLRKQPISENYIIPKQFDTRVVPRVALAVAKVALETGMGEKERLNINTYENLLTKRLKQSP